MAGLVNASRHVALNAIGAVAVYFSLHSADPGTGGTSELTGGIPAYARQLGAWAAAASGEMLIAGGETFDVPAGSTVAYWGCWSAVTVGTFYGSGALAVAEVYVGQGTYLLNAAKIALT